MTTRETLLKLTLKGDNQKPIYTFNESVFERNVMAFKNAFESKFEDYCAIHYSVKTNPHPLVLNAVKKCGIGVEVVSPDEYNLCLDYFTSNQIIYNGVIPDTAAKAQHCIAGGIANIENRTEHISLAKYAVSNRPFKIGIRVNLNSETFVNVKSRFGFDIRSKEFSDVMRGSLEVSGLHCHLWTKRNSEYDVLDFWEKKAHMLGKVAKAYSLEYIDFGSNMFGFMDSRLQAEFNCQIPSPNDYADAIYAGLNSVYKGKKLPKVIIEPGTPVVGNAVSMIGRIVAVDVKKNTATSSCSTYDFGFLDGNGKLPPVDIMHTFSSEQKVSDCIIYGYACTENDVVCRKYNGDVSVGDIVIFRNLGAYAYSLSSDFIVKSPTMILSEI